MANTFKFGNGEWAVGKETALAYNDENSNFKPLPFTFDRASTATVVNKDGLLETVGTDEPRIDFLNNTNGHLLLEPSRSNELTDSSMNNFSAVRCSRGDEVIKLGIIEGYKYSFTDANPNVNFNYSESTLGYKTFSVFIDATNSDEFQIFLATELSSKAASSTFTPSTRSFSSITENSTYVRNSSVGYEYFGNNIYRIFITTEFILYDSGSTRPLLYFGDNTNVWIGGAQIEQGSYATSYIPTSGQSGGVTRSAENITQTTPNLSNSQEVTAFIDLGARPLTGSNSTSDAIEFFFASNNRIVYNQNGSSKHRIEINTDGNSTRNYFSTTTFSTTPIKIAIAVTQSTLKIYTNRGDSWNVPIEGVADWSNLSIVKTNIIQSIGNIKINDLRVYNTALTDAELIALTS